MSLNLEEAKVIIRHEAFEKFKDRMEALGYNLHFSETEAIETVQKALVSSLKNEEAEREKGD